jgi:hypothetical protein
MPLHGRYPDPAFTVALDSGHNTMRPGLVLISACLSAFITSIAGGLSHQTPEL